MSACHFCGAPLDPKMRVVRDAECPKCGRDLHACVQCRHYDRHAHNQCREPQAEWCPDKDKANFCEFFEFRETSAIGRAGIGGGPVSDQSRARSAFDSLFKK